MMETLYGGSIEACWQEIALLRIQVFRDFPYLYEGTLEYERSYLQTYIGCPDSLVCLVRAEPGVVGASTAIPLAQETEEFRRPLAEHGYDPTEFLYLGESVLLPAYRNQGWGHRFFDMREQHARTLGLPRTCFCAVARAHAPADYRPLGDFWRKRGYVEQPHIVTTFSWKDVGETQETPKTLTFWVNSLDG